MFVYPLRRSVEGVMRGVVVEAMLTTCPSLVPVGHHFHNMLLGKESGHLCGPFAEWKEATQRLYWDYLH